MRTDATVHLAIWLWQIGYGDPAIARSGLSILIGVVGHRLTIGYV